MSNLQSIQSQIDDLVSKKMALTGKPRWDCQAMVLRENPELRQQYVAAKNGAKK